jgi:mxaJ protein
MPIRTAGIVRPPPQPEESTFFPARARTRPRRMARGVLPARGAAFAALGACLRLTTPLVLALLLAAAPAAARELRVCADPNNLPFSNRRGEGFENRIAERIARALGAELDYTWWPQRRGFLRQTLLAGRCDLVIGVPTSLELVLATRPYYRSSYVFLAAPGVPLVRSLDDPRLRTLRIGVHLIGDDYANPPPVHALGRRGIVTNVTGYTIYGDYSEPDPPARLIEALGRGELDVAIVWGPLAGYFRRRVDPPLAMAPVTPQVDLPFLPMVFDIAMGVRRGEEAFRDELDEVLVRERGEIAEILASYGVPRLDVPAAAAAGR